MHHLLAFSLSRHTVGWLKMARERVWVEAAQAQSWPFALCPNTYLRVCYFEFTTTEWLILPLFRMSRGSDNVTTCESRRWYQQWWCHHLWYMEMLHQTSEILTNCGRLIVMSREMRHSCEGGTSGFGILRSYHYTAWNLPLINRRASLFLPFSLFPVLS
jgi:hypothetical protein